MLRIAKCYKNVHYDIITWGIIDNTGKCNWFSFSTQVGIIMSKRTEEQCHIAIEHLEAGANKSGAA